MKKLSPSKATSRKKTQPAAIEPTEELPRQNIDETARFVIEGRDCRASPASNDDKINAANRKPKEDLANSGKLVE